MTKAKCKPETPAPDQPPEDKSIQDHETGDQETRDQEAEDQGIQGEDELVFEDEFQLETPFSLDRGAQAPTIESMTRQLADKDAEIGELKDQLLRTLAEAENVRRRADRDRQDAAKYAATPFARDILPVADNLARAIESLRQDAADDDRIASLLAGVELTQKDLLSAFERHNISKVDPIGERLDPHRHEAMFEVPHETAPNGTVVQVVEPGYLLHDRLLRPARVGVAKAIPQAIPEAILEAPEPEETGDSEGEPKLKSSA